MPNETLTSKNLPPAQQPGAVTASPPPGLKPVTDVEIPFDQIEAKPLRAPSFINLKPRNPNISLFWGNRAVGEKESGLRYDQLVAMGFVPAKPEDVTQLDGKPVPPSIVRDGRVMYGDLILLKIARELYVGALKWNQQSAVARVRKPGVAIAGGSKEHQAADGRINPGAVLPPHPKVKGFVPDLAETDAKTSDNMRDFNLADRGKPL